MACVSAPGLRGQGIDSKGASITIESFLGSFVSHNPFSVATCGVTKYTYSPNKKTHTEKIPKLKTKIVCLY